MRKIVKKIGWLLCIMGILNIVIEPMCVSATSMQEVSSLGEVSVSGNDTETVSEILFELNSAYEGILNEEEVRAEIQEIIDFRNSVSLFGTVRSFSTLETAQEYVRTQMTGRESTVTFRIPYSVWSSLDEPCVEIVKGAMAHYDGCSGQEGDALLLGCKGWGANVSISNDMVEITYTFSYHSTYEQEELLTAKLEAAYAELALDNLSEYEKVKKIYNYICDHVDYDYNLEKRSAYEALCNGKSVCQGYAALFYRMCVDSGLSVRVVTGLGNGGSHAWNIVKIGNYYYNVDATWDGETENTYSRYFLLNENSFGATHIRDDEYATDSFNAQYPMSPNSWVDYNSFDEPLNATNYNYSFTTLDGTTVDTNASGKNKVLIFFSTVCFNSQSTISGIRQEDFSNVDIIAIDAAKHSKDEVAAFKDTYADDSLALCYDAGSTASGVMWSYVDLIDSNSVSYPIIVYIDVENKVQKVTTGTASASQITANIEYYCTAMELTLSSSSLSMNTGDSQNIIPYVNGEAKEACGFSWSSSNTNVATVDANGVIKAIDDGTCTITCTLNSKKAATVKVTVKTVLSQPKVKVENMANGVKVTWNKVSNAAGYYVYRKEAGGKYSKIKKITSASTLEYIDTSAVAGTSYYYTVRAYKGSTLSTYSGKSIVYLAEPKLSVTNAGNGATLKWTKSAGAKGYYIYRKVKGTSGYTLIDTISNGNTLNYTDTQAESGTIYYYAVRAYNGKSKSSYTTVKDTYLSEPVVTASNTKTGTNLKWKKVTGAKGYYVYRKVKGTKGYIMIDTITDGNIVTYIDTNAVSGTTYYYAVRAYNGKYKSSYTTVKSTYLTEPQVTAKNTGSGVKLSWTESDGADGYYVYRKEVGGKYTVIKTISDSSILTYTDIGAKAGKTYYYTVRAYKGKVMSSYTGVKKKFTK